MVASIQYTQSGAALESTSAWLSNYFDVGAFPGSVIVWSISGYKWNYGSVSYPSYSQVRWEPTGGTTQNAEFVTSVTSYMPLVRYDTSGYMAIRSSIYILRDPTPGNGRVKFAKSTTTNQGMYGRIAYVKGVGTDQDVDVDSSLSYVSGCELGGTIDLAGGLSVGAMTAFYGLGSYGSTPENEYLEIGNAVTERSSSGAFSYSYTFSTYNKIFAQAVAWWEPGSQTSSRPLFASFGGM